MDNPVFLLLHPVLSLALGFSSISRGRFVQNSFVVFICGAQISRGLRGSVLLFPKESHGGGNCVLADVITPRPPPATLQRDFLGKHLLCAIPGSVPGQAGAVWAGGRNPCPWEWAETEPQIILGSWDDPRVTEGDSLAGFQKNKPQQPHPIAEPTGEKGRGGTGEL